MPIPQFVCTDYALVSFLCIEQMQTEKSLFSHTTVFFQCYTSLSSHCYVYSFHSPNFAANVLTQNVFPCASWTTRVNWFIHRCHCTCVLCACVLLYMFIVCLSWLYFSDTCLCRSWSWRMRSVRSYWRSGTRWERSSRSSPQVCLRWGQYISRIRAILRWERSSRSSPQVCLSWGQHISSKDKGNIKMGEELKELTASLFEVRATYI